MEIKINKISVRVASQSWKMQRGLRRQTNYRSWKYIVKSCLKVLRPTQVDIFRPNSGSRTHNNNINNNRKYNDVYIIHPQRRNTLVCCCWCKYSQSRLVKIETYAFVEYGAVVLSVWITAGRPVARVHPSERAFHLVCQRCSRSPPTKGDRQRRSHSRATLMPFSRRCVCSDNQCQSAWRSCALR